MSDPTDTICAPATPPGRSGIAVIRLSGKLCLKIVSAIFFRKSRVTEPEHGKAAVGRLVDPQSNEEIDEAIVTFFKAPHSYTGEDMAEFSLHGNPALVGALLDVLCRLGSRLAEPGEFTQRAFLHGRIDLAQAEAIRDIIEARTLYQARLAGRQRDGAAARELRPLKEKLIETIVHLESAVEFAEENLPVASRDALAISLEEMIPRVGRWIQSYSLGRMLREGIRLAVTGRPNVGKSSIFNALLGQERSIVSDIPGTTRDMVTESIGIGGIPVYLQDTAGLRDGGDGIEKLGMERSRTAIADADFVLFVIDASRELSEEDFRFKAQLNSSTCAVVMNKSDLKPALTEKTKQSFAEDRFYLDVSAKTGQGIEDLRGWIQRKISDDLPAEGLIITNLRHCQALERAEQHLRLGAEALKKGLSEEFALFDLRKGLDALGEITGETQTEDLLDEIFSRFCVGK